MNIKDFIKSYSNHPILFIGSGFSIRYLENSFNWENLLKKISYDLKGNNEFFFDLKHDCFFDGKYNYAIMASKLEKEFDHDLRNNRDGDFSWINDKYYELAEKDELCSRMKIYISEQLSNHTIRENMSEEIAALKRVRKNIGSIITTNYDTLIEEIFQFNTLIGNNILLSNPYGSIYKIHGCVTSPKDIIITKNDYDNFDQKYDLIRAQLLSLFIHNPIIFMGYSITDENIRKILKTIFSYVDKDSVEAQKIRNNFLLIEYEKGSDNQDVLEHDIVIDANTTITVNKIKTDNFMGIYDALANLQLPISAMDIRKVQTVVREIYSGGNIKVNIVDDIDDLQNNEKVVAIGNVNRITYVFHTIPEIIQKYFEIIDEDNKQILTLIDKHNIQSSQFFPIFGFSLISNDIKSSNQLKLNQIKKIENIKEKTKGIQLDDYASISGIMLSESIAKSKKVDYIAKGILTEHFTLDDCMNFLKRYEQKNCTDYKKLLCVYDYVKYYINEKTNVEGGF